MINIQIQNGAISTGTIPRMVGYQEFTNELEKLVPYIHQGQLALDPSIGIMAEIMFVNGQCLNIITQCNNGKVWYSLNSKVYDREGAVRVMVDFRHKVENIFKTSKSSIEAKELYMKLTKCCNSLKDGGLLVFDNVHTGGSDDSWSSSGNRLSAYLENNKVKFVYEKIDRGETHIMWDDSITKVRYYPGEVTVKEIVDLCTRNGKVLK